MTTGRRFGRGERYGMIRFGSRTELIVPTSALDELTCQVGDTVFGGKLCGKGNFALEFINHPYRLIEPTADESPITWPAAIKNLSRELAAGESVGVIIGSQASLEDSVLATQFVKSCLPKGRIAFSLPTGDDAVHR